MEKCFTLYYSLYCYSPSIPMCPLCTPSQTIHFALGAFWGSCASKTFHYHPPKLRENAPTKLHSTRLKQTSGRKNISVVAHKPAVSKLRSESTAH